MTTRPTMRDVASAAAVSLKTVSRVVNEEPGVRAETVERVTTAIERLGFHRNDLARSLRPGQSSRTIGLVIGDLGNPFFSGMARAIEEVAHAHGHHLLVGSSGEDPIHERDLIRRFVARRVDGVLIVPAPGDHASVEHELDLGLPVVFLDRPASTVRGDVVVLDNAGGARKGVEHLLRQGHRRIGLLADDVGIHTAHERVEGYRAALAAAGVPLDRALLRLSCGNVDGARAAVDELLDVDDPITAIFTVNNRMSLGALRALYGRTERIAMVGFDELEYADILETPVTVVAHDPYQLGRHGADVLFERLAGAEDPPRHLVLPTKLLVRGSGEVAP
jgi:LacI family transcriptional regulator